MECKRRGVSFHALERIFWDNFWRAREREELARSGKQVTLRSSERGTLIEALAQSFPCDSILEVGCAFGQNLAVFAHLVPGTSICGVDRNGAALKEAEAFFKTLRSQSAPRFVKGSVDDLSMFASLSFDVVYTCALFLYVRPDEAEPAARELLRVAKRKVLLLEQHVEDRNNPQLHLGVFVQRGAGPAGYWLRDYRRLFSQFVPDGNIKVTKVLHPNWEAERWKSAANLIEITVSPEIT
jgi:SAM-dependent methyltransferase